MKTSAIIKHFALVSFTCLTVSGAQGAVERVQFLNEKIFVWQNGTVKVTTNEVYLPFSIVVKTNGTFAVKGGRDRPLDEGDLLGADGMLLKRDGTITPVMAHITSNRGEIVVVQDGIPAVVTGAARLPDGTTVRADRRISRPDGSARWMLDGELFFTEGGRLPARDTVTVQDGEVQVQKDGSTLSIGRTRSIMMNDGTKVRGDGTVVYFNGEQAHLADGQILVIEGVRRR